MKLGVKIAKGLSVFYRLNTLKNQTNDILYIILMYSLNSGVPIAQ